MIRLKDLLIEQPIGATMGQVRNRAQELSKHITRRADLIKQLQKEFPDADYEVLKFIVYTKGAGIGETHNINECAICRAREFTRKYNISSGKFKKWAREVNADSSPRGKEQKIKEFGKYQLSLHDRDMPEFLRLANQLFRGIE